MFLRSVVFVAVCAPVWAMYSISHGQQAGKPLPAISAVVWTGVQGTLCFAGPLTRRPVHRHGGRHVRVIRKTSRGGRVPTVRVVGPAAAMPAATGPATVDVRLWPRIQRAMNGCSDPAAGPRVVRPATRRGPVRFFDGRLTLCGVGGVVLENPRITPPPMDARRRTG